MRTDIDTTKIAPNRRLTFWREAVCANLVGVECFASRKPTLNGRFTQIEHEGFAIARLRAEAHKAIRERSTLRKSDTDFYMLFLQKSGTMRVRRNNRDFVVRPGDMYFYDGATEHQLVFDEHFDHLAIRIPRKILEKRWSALADIGSFRTKPDESVVDRVLMPMAGAAIGSSSAQELPAVVISVIDLFAFRLDEDKRAVQNETDYARLILTKAEYFIDDHLEDSDLDAERTARAFRISRRQLDRLLAQSATSFSKLLMAKRLNRAADLLEDPKMAGHSITRIALEVGFENHSFFARKFRERFGTTPRAYRSINLERMQSFSVQ